MIRLQIQLDPDRARELRRAAEEDGVSQAEVVRRALGAYLGERRLPDEAAVQRAVALIGKGSSGRPDLAEDHDHYLAKATIAWRAAKRRRLSLVDCVSFALMRRDDIRAAFAFDRDFEEEGFAVVPSGR